MQAQNVKNLRANLNLGFIKIRTKELSLYHDSLSENGIGLGAALVAELAMMTLYNGCFLSSSFTSLHAGFVPDEQQEHGASSSSSSSSWADTFTWPTSPPPPRVSSHLWLHRCFVFFTILAFVTSINAVVICGAAVIFGPSLALRGSTAEDVEKAVTGMREERKYAFRFLVGALASLSAALACLAAMRLLAVTDPLTRAEALRDWGEKGSDSGGGDEGDEDGGGSEDEDDGTDATINEDDGGGGVHSSSGEQGLSALGLGLGGGCLLLVGAAVALVARFGLARVKRRFSLAADRNGASKED